MKVSLIECTARAMADYACVNYENNSEIYRAYAKAALNCLRDPPINRGEIYNQVWNNAIDKAIKEEI